MRLNASLSTDLVATVLTACGIETRWIERPRERYIKLQQYLPLAVLKLSSKIIDVLANITSCNSTYRLRY